MSLQDGSYQKLRNYVYILLKLYRKNSGLFFSGHGVCINMDGSMDSISSVTDTTVVNAIFGHFDIFIPIESTYDSCIPTNPAPLIPHAAYTLHAYFFATDAVFFANANDTTVVMSLALIWDHTELPSTRHK